MVSQRSCDPLLPCTLTVEEYFTPLTQKGKQALIHWIYYPDSYDCWVPASEVGVAPEPATDPPKQWLVSILIDAHLLIIWLLG